MFSKKYFFSFFLIICFFSLFFVKGGDLELKKVFAATDCPDCALWGNAQITGPYYKSVGTKCYKYYEKTIPCAKNKNGTPSNCEINISPYNQTEIGCEAYCKGCQTAGCGQISAVGIRGWKDVGGGYKCECTEPIGNGYYASCKGESVMWDNKNNAPSWWSYLCGCVSSSGTKKCIKPDNPDSHYYNSEMGSCGVSGTSCNEMPGWPFGYSYPYCASDGVCGESCPGGYGGKGGLTGPCCATGCKEGLTCCTTTSGKKSLKSCATWKCNTSNYTCGWVAE